MYIQFTSCIYGVQQFSSDCQYFTFKTFIKICSTLVKHQFESPLTCQTITHTKHINTKKAGNRTKHVIMHSTPLLKFLRATLVNMYQNCTEFSFSNIIPVDKNNRSKLLLQCIFCQHILHTAIKFGKQQPEVFFKKRCS